MKNIASAISLIFIAAAALVAANGIFTVKETEQAIVTQFGDPVGEPLTKAGLHFKLPFVQTVNSIPKLVLEWDGQAREMPTKDKTYIIVDTFARWRIVDPLLYYEKLRNERSALSRLDDILGSETRKAVGNHELVEVVRTTKGRTALQSDAVIEGETSTTELKPIRFGRSVLEGEITRQAEDKLLNFGIELLDIRFKRVNYKPEVQKNIYTRMISERARIAERFRSEGDGEANRILGEMERSLKEIESEAYRQVETIKGEADAEAARVYAEAYNQSPAATGFYEFTRTMDTYKSILGPDTTVVLSTNSDLFQFLKGVEPETRKKPAPGAGGLDPEGELPLFLRDN